MDEQTYQHGANPASHLGASLGTKVEWRALLAVDGERELLASLACNVGDLGDSGVVQVHDARWLETELGALVLTEAH